MLFNKSVEQSILIEAYLKDKEDWDRRISNLDHSIKDQEADIKWAESICNKENVIKLMFYRYVLKKTTLKQDYYIKSQKELIRLLKQKESLLKKEPNPDIYEMAMYGGKLFSG